MSTAVSKITDHLFRHESGKMIAVLTRLLGTAHWDTAQDIVQDTLLQAMTVWSFHSIPDNPTGWLHRVARNKAIDYIRREKKFQNIRPQYAYLLESEWALSSTVHQLFLENEIHDSQLRMMFACCHPSIAPESQVALILKTLCGLSTSEIARSFLTGEDTITKRIYRAKEKIRSEKIKMDVPSGNELGERLDAVLRSLYLLFNEGYNSSHPDWLIREDLCQEAMRLCLLLTEHAHTGYPRVKALLSLMCFQASRLPARLDDKGNIILLKYQDREKWYRPLIQKGFEYMDDSSAPFEISPFQLEASIASLHAAAPSFEKTDWTRIHQLYEWLYQLQPNPVVAMNKAIAAAYAISPQESLRLLQDIRGLEKNHIYHACLGEVYLDLHNRPQAKHSFEQALSLTSSRSEQLLLQQKISLC
jgi:RNA polymerase sigma factor (sigma-70 family)